MDDNAYKPIFNSEADFKQLWKNPHCESKCFKDSIDDIYSDSFVFRSFRNEYETDSLFNQFSFNLLKKGSLNFDSIENEVGESPASVYIPGYKVQSFLPSCSELTRTEMTECFHMYEDICKNKNLSPQKLSIYNKYHEVIQNEQRLYQGICKSAWYGVNYRRTNEIKNEIKDYTSKLWKKRVERVSWYPKHYSKFSDVSLIDDSERKSELLFSKQLQRLGYSRFCSIPSLKKKRLNIFNSLCGPDNVEESEDNVGQGLKYYKSVHSSLRLKGYHPDVSKDKVAESLATQNKANVVLSASSFLCLLDNHPEAGARSWELPIVIKENEEGGSKHKVVYIDKVFPPKSLSAVQRNKWFCKKKIYKLLECPRRKPFKERGSEDIVSYDDIDNSFDGTAYDISKLESFGVENEHFEVKKHERNEKRIERRNSDSENPDDFNPNKSGSSLGDALPSDNEEKLLLSLDSEEDELVIDVDDPVESKQEDDEVVIEENVNSTITPDLPPKKVEKKEDKITEAISYHLWSLKCEASNVLLKTNLKDLDLIIRCKEHARFMGPQKYTVSTKLEYQSEFGAEVTTHSELTRDWGNTLIRPDNMLLRVRLDPISGDLIMYEMKSLHDLTIDFQRQYSKTPYNKLTSLHALLGQLSDLPPGNYMLSHSPENGSFALLFREEKSKHTYNSYLGYLNIDFDSIDTAKGMWLQIDQMVLTPTCAHFFRIPATFHPKVTKCSSKLDFVTPEEKVKERKEKILKMKRKRRTLKRQNRKKKKLAAATNKNNEKDISENVD